MITVEGYELVRRKYHIDGKSIRQIAKELGHSRRTVKKILGLVSPPGYRQTKPRGQPVLGPYVGVIESWLEEDSRRPRKQLHTGHRVYEPLWEELDYRLEAAGTRQFIEICS